MRETKLKKLIVASAVLTALSIPALADPGTEIGNKIGWNNPNNPHHSGVPGPLAGAGLPFIAVGYGVYWLVRRRRKAN